MLSTNTYIDTIIKLSIESRGTNKYLNWYISIIKKSQNRNLTEYTEKHHIVPDCFYINRKRKGRAGFLEGSGEHKNNFVRLTPEEHQLAHLLLVKMFDENFKYYKSLLHSADMMSVNSSGNRINAKTYAWLKKKLSMLKSISMQGNAFRKGIPNKNKGSKNPELSKRMLGNRINVGKKYTKERTEKCAESNRRLYKCISPSGTELITKNLKQFCADNGLTYQNMNKVSNNKRPHHKGWKCILISE
jgi:hypothetical protein